MHATKRPLRAISIAFACSFLLTAAFARAADHFLAIGGGDSPTNNQVSLEKNVLFFQRLLSDCQGAVPDVLFSNGKAGTRDLQFEPDEDPPRINILLARLLGREWDVNYHYRKHEIPGLSGPSTHAGLENWFNTEGKKLTDGDRLIIYFTGHGGPGRPPQNTTLSMWCERPMEVTEFTGLLDRLSPKVQVVLIMVQCHSGGFASTIFKNGKVGTELSTARRCGFFATTYDRNAAGCTPDTAEDDYKDYSTYFFAALDGKTRTGKPIGKCDLDGDGRVSFAEAHAYTLIHSDTIDVPTTTSEALLRQFSKSTGNWNTRPQMPFQTLLTRASVTQKAVLEGLSDQLKLSGDDRQTEVNHLADLIESERKTAERDEKQKQRELDNLTNNIRTRLLQRWPELSNSWSPQTMDLLAHQAPAIMDAIDKDSDAARWELLRRDINKLEDHQLDLERRWVKCRRLSRMLETTALAANLKKFAPPEIVERYKQMVEDEGGVLSPKALAGAGAEK
ncbi:MAG TPA: C13 family peptidase [Tepidisphaeraceae bacterium]|jgi:hypothetical protein|nr:C13 family peptidase [Tepidisphaeraceae bacterium]